LLKLKTILICPLEWGLGHAGRMVPLAEELINLGHNVIIGSGPAHLEFFKKELPHIKYIRFPGFSIRYSSWLPQYLVILFNSPLFIYHIIKEHRQLKKIITAHKIDIVISDSRPGLWNRSVKTVFVTHMIRVPMPRWGAFIEKTGLFSSKWIIRKFSLCFIPDLEGDNNLSGKLSHSVKLPANARYIGILSRFSATEGAPPSGENSCFCTVILSGPEPQRSIFKQKMEAILRFKGEKSLILEGKPGQLTEKRTEGNITYLSHLPMAEMRDFICSSRFVASRSGYTTLMELASLGKTALIIPTPGQTEQEYLADYLSSKGWFSTILQKELHGDPFQPERKSGIPENILAESKKLLESALNELLKEDHK
jgi:UDP:flavonoid glycosyltransferase YjiC (YdhE family)